MTTVNKKRVRNLSSSTSDSDDVDQANPKTQKNGKIGESCRGKMQNLGQNEVKSNACLVCDGEDNWVLVCYGEECPIAIHQSCASDEPDFDEFGNFYCPYCWYKRVVVKSVELGKKLMVNDKCRKCRESLGGGVDLGLMVDRETEDVENVVEVDVSGGRVLASGKRRGGHIGKNQYDKTVETEIQEKEVSEDGKRKQERGLERCRRITNVDPSGNRRKGDEPNKCIVMEKSQKMKEVAAETLSWGNSKADGTDSDKRRKQRGRSNENHHETSDAFSSNSDEAHEGRKRRGRGSEKTHEQVQANNSDVGGERKPQRRCDNISHESAQARSFVVGVKTREKRKYGEKNQQNKTVAGIHEQDDVDQANPKTQKNGKIGESYRGKMQNLGPNEVKSNTCFVCDGEDNWVLVCYGEECPIAIHQSCASDEPDFDEFGNFYCPYCWYKRVVMKCVELGKKLMVNDKSRKCRESLGGVDLGLMVDRETENVENVVEVDVSGGRILASGKRRGRHIGKNQYDKTVETEIQEKEVSEDGKRKWERGLERCRRITNVDPSGNRREGDEPNKKCIVMEKSQKMKEVAAETLSRGNSKADGTDKRRKQRGRFNEKHHETSDAFISNSDEAHEGRKWRGSGSEKTHEKVQVNNSAIGGERKPQRRWDNINHESAQAHSFDVGVKTREKGKYSEKNQQNKTVAVTHEQDVFINGEETQVRDSYLGEGRSGQGCCHENNQENKLSSTEICEQEIPMTDKRVSHGSGLEGRCQEGRHIEKSQHTKTVETETHGTEVSKDRKRKRERGMERDGDEFCLAKKQHRQCQADMRNDDVAFRNQEICFRKDEQVERKSVSSLSSPESTDSVIESNAASQEFALIIHPKAGVQERPIEARPICSVSSTQPSFQPEKYGHKSYLEKNGTGSNAPGQRKFVLCSDRKRKRLLWTQAEEEMLRVGVQKFPSGRNIPWRKILEFGRDVFHDERVPSDLKDKWKTLNKMPSDTGKWVSLSTEKGQPNYYVTEVNSE